MGIPPVDTKSELASQRQAAWRLLRASALCNGGLAVARAVRRNAGKVGGRTLECSNAPELGLGSVAEATMADHEAGQPGILLAAARPSQLPEPTMTDDELRPLLAEVYADAPWISLDRILVEVRDPGTPWDEAVRYYFNAPAGGAAVLVEPAPLGRAGAR